MEEVKPVKNYIPKELNLDPLTYEDAERSKRGMEDSSLEAYYHNDVVTVYEVDEANSTGNIHIPDLVIEKNPDESKFENELKYGILLDELGAGPDIQYVRNNEEGEMTYGMEFCRDGGLIRDIDFNGFPDFLDYVEAAGEAYGPLYDADLLHEDLIGQRQGGNFRFTPYLRNMLFAGSSDKAKLIDMEDTHFSEETPIKGESPHLAEMNPDTRDDEYSAVLSALVVEGLEHVDFFEEVADGEIRKTYFMDQDGRTGLDQVNLKKLSESPASNNEFNALLDEVRYRFEKGFHNGQLDARKFYHNISESDIPRNHEAKNTLKEATRDRMEEDIEPEVQEWIKELE